MIIVKDGIISLLIILLLISPILTVYAEPQSNKTTEPKKFAIIITGCYGTGNGKRTFEENEEFRSTSYGYYLWDVQRFYNVLKNRYNYNDDNIIVLLTKRDEYETNEPFDDSIIDYTSNKHNLKKVLNSFKTGGKNHLIETDSLLFIYIGHGLDGYYFINHYLNRTDPDGVDAHDTFFALEPRNNFLFKNIFKYEFLYYRMFFPNYALWDYQLANYMKGIKAKTIFLLQPCNSGGFINDLSRENRIVCTSSKENEMADSWIGPFRKALNFEEGVDADTNHDGNVSIAEAYRYAAEFSTNYSKLGPQHPLIDDNGDKIGHYYNESGYDPNCEGKDGFLANHTFL